MSNKYTLEAPYQGHSQLRTPIETYYNPLWLLAPLRGYDDRAGNSFRDKTKIMNYKGFTFRPETEAYYLFAGENQFVGGAMHMLLRPNKSVEYGESLGLVELCSVILPVAVLSEWLNNMLYQRSLLTNTYNSGQPFYKAINDLFDGLSSKRIDSTGQALKSLLFTALWGLYQTIRVPVLLAAMFTALVLWIPKMIVGFVMGTSVFASRPAWYPIAAGFNALHDKYEDYKEERGQQTDRYALAVDLEEHDGAPGQQGYLAPPATGDGEPPAFEEENAVTYQ